MSGAGRVVVALAAATFLGGCKPAPSSGPPTEAKGPPVVAEAFQTASYPEANLDSMAVWRPAIGEAELLTTAKTADVLLVFSAADGRLLRAIGASGIKPGQFRRPNGIAIEGDVAIVVERDNARLQVLRLGEDRSLGTFGSDVLQRPYGVAMFTGPDGWLVVYVTDNYETLLGGIPPNEELDHRVHEFRLRIDGDRLEVRHVRAFGDISGPGVLRKVETIAVDPVHNRVLVAEEDAAIREIKVYTLEGKFTGQVLGGALFRTEPEGLALYACGDDGFWVATDQHPEENVFHVLDRRTLTLRGSFRGARTQQTDGIALIRGAVGALAGGAFYAAHRDAQVSAFAWDTIAGTLRLEQPHCR